MKLIVVSFFLFFSTLSFAKTEGFDVIILTKKTIRSLIGSYPEIGSEKHHADFEQLHYYQSTRTASDCESAEHDEKLSLKQLYRGILTSKEIVAATVFMADVYATVGVNAYKAKYMYKRPRPYDFDGSLSPCISREKSYAYPSGHTMTARLTARILGATYPKRAAALLKRADEFALHRVVGGVHHPSDIEAGKILSDHLASLILKKKSSL